MSIKKMLCTLGKFDIPIIQMQPPFVVDLLDSNVVVFGTSMSGKTTFVKLLLNVLHKQYYEKEEQIFILDFGGALAKYQEMPLVSAYFDNSNEEYVKRVFKIMDSILKENIKELNGKNYRDAEIQALHTTFIIDNLNGFIEEPRYAAYHEKLAKLCREGLSKGITIIVTASDTKGIGAYLTGFKQKIAFEMPQDKYAEIFNGKVALIGNNPGHGFANVTVKPDDITGTFRMNLPYEVQCSLPYRLEDDQGNADTEETFIEKLKLKFSYSENKYLKCIKKYQTFPKELTREEYNKLIQDVSESFQPIQNSITVGLDYVNFHPVSVNLNKTHVIAIYGKKEFGKTNLLNLLIQGYIKQNNEFRIVFFDDGRRQLEPIYQKVKNNIDSIYINDFKEIELCLKDESKKIKKLSPVQQFYLYLNENYMSIDKRFLASIYGVSKELPKEYNKIPDCNNENTPTTLFVIQSKLTYLNAAENRFFINNILPQLSAVAEERKFWFIFSDVQKISDAEQNVFFNNAISTAFLLDNIAEFAGERGQKTLFGNMDVKSLKEDYAKCEIGDGYFYDVEADNLLKLKFIKN